MRAILLFELRRMLRGRTALALALALGTLLAMCAMLSAPYATQSGLALPGAAALVYHSVLSQFGFIVLGTIYCYAFARDFDGTWRFYAQAGVAPRRAVLARLALLSLFSVIAAAAMYLEEAMVLCNGVGDEAVRKQGHLHVHDVLQRYFFD